MINYLKRRFSSGDLQGELQDQHEQELRLAALKNDPTNINFNQNNNNNNANANANSHFTNMFNFSTTRKGPSPSAPSSPSKNISFADSVMNVARVMMNTNTSGINTNNSHQFASHNNYNSIGSKFVINKDKTRILLVIDDEHTDWSKYFRNRKLNNEHDIRVEQAEFKDLNLAAYSDSGVMVDIDIVRNGTKVVRSFKPDFVLIRQHVKDINIDWKNIIIGLQYGNVPCVNSLYSTYNFIDRAWVFSELVKINRKLGNEAFPLITQAYYPNHKEMLTSPIFPCVVKIGNAHQGLGKVRVQNPYEFQDISSIVAISRCYSTTEPFIDCKCDVQIQKIGNHYKAFMRKSITNQWKANTGSAMLEQIPMNDKYKLWIDEVSKIFGGLDICAVKAVMDNDLKEYIIQVNGSSFTLLGESQEDDRRLIAELVIDKMSQIFRTNEIPKQNITPKEQIHQNEPIQIIPAASIPPMTINHPSVPTHNLTKENSNLPPAPGRQLPTIPNRQQQSPTKFQSLNNQNSIPDGKPPTQNTASNLNNNLNNNYQISNNKINSLSTTTPTSSSSSIASTHSIPPTKPARPQLSNQLSQPMQPQQQQQQIPHQQKQTNNPQMHPKPPPPQRPNVTRESSQNSQVDDSDDTMKNLRKTFAGIFGEM